MADLKVTFTLSDRDVKHLRRIMRKASAAAKTRDEDAILKAGKAMASEVRKFKPPEYVIHRVGQLETMIEMIEDKQWNVPQAVRRKVLTALNYFNHPADLIPDTVPGLGFLDDAIMIELAARELKHELSGYRAFVTFRDSAQQRPWTKAGGKALEKPLMAERKKLRRRIAAREQADEAKAEGAGRGRFRLW